jgi:polyhydroxybutyrate depolymerase
VLKGEGVVVVVGKGLVARVGVAVGVVVVTLVVSAVGLYGYLIWTPAAEGGGLTGESARVALSVGGRERTYTVYVPAGVAAGAPLLVVLHGSFEDGATIRRNAGYGFDREADRHGFAVVYPDGYEGGWNDCRRLASTPARKENVDDTAFVEALIADLQRRAGVDVGRTFVAGYSNGGQMAYRLAADLPGRIAGIATIAANLPADGDNTCVLRTALPALMMAGTADPISPFTGGDVTIFGFAARGEVMSADDTVRTFAALNGLTAAPVVAELPHRGDTPTSVTRADYREAGRAPVTRYTITNGGHVIPTTAHRGRRILGPTSHDLDAPTAIWEFFSRSGQER